MWPNVALCVVWVVCVMCVVSDGVIERQQTPTHHRNTRSQCLQISHYLRPTQKFISKRSEMWLSLASHCQMSAYCEVWTYFLSWKQVFALNTKSQFYSQIEFIFKCIFLLWMLRLDSHSLSFSFQDKHFFRLLFSLWLTLKRNLLY